MCIVLLDIDECASNTHDCDVKADCKNKAGLFVCTCHEGYQGNGKTCEGMNQNRKWLLIDL